MLGVLASGCALESPYFEVKDSCVTVNRRMWIQDLWIRISDPFKSYHITRNHTYDGSQNICLDSIPIGYYVISQRDTLDIRAIPFAEGDTVEIDQPGGDRASYSRSFIYRLGKLTAQE
jgi:hypothetical protein